MKKLAIINGILQILAFDSIWIIGIYAARGESYLYGFSVLLLLLQIGILLLTRKNSGLALAGIMLIAFVGWLIDSLLMLSGVIDFYGKFVSTLAPIWLLQIWISFVIIFCYFFYNQAKHYILWALVGAVVFPLSYYLGCYLGAGHFNLTWISWLTYVLFGVFAMFMMSYMINTKYK